MLAHVRRDDRAGPRLHCASAGRFGVGRSGHAKELEAMTTTSTDTAGLDPPSSAEIAVPSAEQGHRSRLRDLAHRAQTSLRNEALLLAVLAGAFLSRWLIADRNSYWLDELLSVNVYGQWHASAADAVRHLASSSIHPPLYQFFLYNWMNWFGDSERATRTLSNLYITFATLFLYLLVRQAFSRRVAIASAVTFTLMYSPMYYGLETRSYAQTIFLVTLSSYALLRIMRMGAERGWEAALLSPTAVLFTISGAALLLTHYYNFFFWIAQAIVAAAFVLRERAVRAWFSGLCTVAAMFAVQGIIFAAIWGRVTVNDFRRRSGAFAVEDGIQNPIELLSTVVSPNIHAPRTVVWLGVIIGVVMVIGAVASMLRSDGLTALRQRTWTVMYLIGWLVLPLMVVYIVFAVSGVERYSARYWLFSVPPLAALFVLATKEIAELLSRLLRRLWNFRFQSSLFTAVTLFAIVAFILPGTLAAATATKHDWRGIVSQVVDMVEADSENSYIIFETSHRRRPMTDFYFDKYSDRVGPYDTLQRSEERTGEYRILTTDEQVISEHDYLVVLFTHSRTGHFSTALERLEDRYEVRHRQLNRAGRGFIVFDVDGD